MAKYTSPNAPDPNFLISLKSPITMLSIQFTYYNNILLATNSPTTIANKLMRVLSNQDYICKLAIKYQRNHNKLDKQPTPDQLVRNSQIQLISMSIKQAYLKQMDTNSQKQHQQTLQLNCDSLPEQVSSNLLHIEHNTVHISTLKWKELCMEKYIGKITKWQVADRLNLSNNKQPKILISISHIVFPTLKVLNLEYNLLVSIEIINTIAFPCLQQLNLNNNYITHTKNIRRCNWPNLQKLSISGNRIVEVRGISELRSNNLREIVIEHDNVNKVQGYDPRWFFKIQPYGIFQVFSIKSINRIKISNFKQKIAQKYPYIFP